MITTAACIAAYLLSASGDTCGHVIPPPLWPDVAVTTRYWPLDGGINCDGNCTVTADGTAWATTNEHIAACPPAILGATITLHGVGSYRCRDTGSMIGVRWSRHMEQYVVYIDRLTADGPDYVPASYEVEW